MATHLLNIVFGENLWEAQRSHLCQCLEEKDVNTCESSCAALMANQALCYWDKGILVDRTRMDKENLPFKLTMFAQMTTVILYYSFPTEFSDKTE